MLIYVWYINIFQKIIFIHIFKRKLIISFSNHNVLTANNDANQSQLNIQYSIFNIQYSIVINENLSNYFKDWKSYWCKYVNAIVYDIHQTCIESRLTSHFYNLLKNISARWLKHRTILYVHYHVHFYSFSFFEFLNIEKQMQPS